MKRRDAQLESHGAVDDFNDARRLCGLVVEVLNGNSEAGTLNFLETNLSPQAKERKVDYAMLLRRAAIQSGGVDIVSQAIISSNLAEVHVRTRRPDHYAKIYLFTDKKHGDMIREFGLIPEPSPDFLLQDKWPGIQVDESGIVEEIERHVQLHVAHDFFSGVVLVGKGDRTIFHRAVGYAERSFKIPNVLDTKFNLGSMNKMFTSLSIAQLVERGLLSFKDTIHEIIPDYPNKDVALEITIHHLLTHTAGLGTLFDRPKYDRLEKYRDSAAYFPVFAEEQLMFEPGSSRAYSNEGFIVLGAVIEALSHQDYNQYVRDHIFKPTGMLNTDAYAADDVTSNLAVGYARFDDDPFGLASRHSNWRFLGWKGNACGGGYSTGPDLLKFSKALRSYAILSEELTEKLTATAIPGQPYGFGFQGNEVNGRRIVGHSGGGPNSGINSEFAIFWNEGYTVIVLSNYDAPAATNLAGPLNQLLAHQN